MRCDDCGRFTARLNDVPCNPPQGGVDREVCDDCIKIINRDGDHR